MSTFEAKKPRHLVSVLEVLNSGQAQAKKFKGLNLGVYGPRTWRQYTHVLWQILTHPHSRICNLRLEERSKNALARTNAMSQVARWCAEVHLETPRKLEFRYCSSSNVHGLDALANALTHDNARVWHLSIEGGSDATPLPSSVLRSCLEHPGNALASLSILVKRAITEEEAADLAVGFASENCKVTRFRMDFKASNNSVLDGLYALSSLRELEWSGGPAVLSRYDFLTRLGQLLEKPGNELRTLTALGGSWRSDQVAHFAQSLTHVNCRVQTFKSSQTFVKRAAAPLLMSLRHPNCSLTNLSIECNSQGQLSADLEETLKHVNCKLVWLHIGCREAADDDLPIAVANALCAAPLRCRLRSYRGSFGKSPDVLVAFTRSLLSPGNKLTALALNTHSFDSAHSATVAQFFRALRLSNVVRYDDGSRAHKRFVRAFNARFLQVLYVLMSLHHVPRLASRALVRVLPLHQLITTIAETLGWRLDSLRTHE